jgi:glutamyl-tRNA(Gln) amidotransferase subunit E
MDYKKLGLKCGIEIHQQLDTHKLFCQCPSLIREDEPNIEVHRNLKAVVGETGEIDQAAAHEMQKEKTYVYQAYSDTTCLVELDEEPPHPMNQDAINIVLQVSKMLNAKVVDEIQVMRKTVVDGSNTSGFQRTSLVSQHGLVETESGKVRIPTICLEEDAAKIIERGSDRDIYNLCKLGIPLIELATEPDMFTPEHAQEVAGHIGMILRSTGKVKRGIGTIRQDVNVSIKGGDRIEIKGAQDLKLIPLWVENEAKRQICLLEIKKLVKEIKIPEEIHDITPLFKKSESKVIKSALSKKGAIKAIKLPSFATLLGKETMPGRRVGSELSDYGKQAGGVGGLFHSDELPKYGITEEDVENIRSLLKCHDKDAFIMIADQENKVDKALRAVIKRAKHFEIGIIKEVRKPNDDGTSSFMRPMPGAARMYPETDIIPVKISTSHLDKIELPELLTERSTRIVENYKLGQDLADVITKSGLANLFEEFVTEFKKVKPAFIAETLIATPKEVKKKINKEFSITDSQFKEIFSALHNSKIAKSAIFDIITDIANDKYDLSKYSLMDDKELEKELKKLITENKDADERRLMGIVMSKLKGKADPKKIMEFLKKKS